MSIWRSAYDRLPAELQLRPDNRILLFTTRVKWHVG